MNNEDYEKYKIGTLSNDNIDFINSLGFSDDQIEGNPNPTPISKQTGLFPRVISYPPTIVDNLTTINYTNTSNKKNQYIVIHYTANNGDTAQDNANYFKSTYRGASANYFVDEYSQIVRCVPDNKIAWHCGTTGTYYHSYCRNTNSIGIELCSRKYSDGTYYFRNDTVNNAAWLTAKLMHDYGIPISNVIRHYDVTHKICPAPFVNNTQQWSDFLKLVQNIYNGDDLTMTQYEELKQLINNQASIINRQQETINSLSSDNKILKEAIGWTNPSDPALYTYVDSNSAKISNDTNEILTKLINEGKLGIDSNGAFQPLTKADIRLLVIMNRPDE